jgi:DNA modification methylase
MTNPKITMVPTGKLIPYARNPRTHSDEQVGQIAASIKEFGWLVPAVVDAENVLIAGHGRILAAQKLGLDKVPTVDGSHLTPAQVQAFRIAENKLALNAGWDEELLKIELGDLMEADYGIDFTGFSDEEISKLIGEPLAGNTDPDATPEPLPDPVSEKGDIWILGPHRVMCGDATSDDDADRLMAREKAAMIFADPPYGVSYAAKNEFLNAIGRGNRIQTPIEKDHESPEEMADFWEAAFTTTYASMADGASYYVTGPQGGDLLLLLLQSLRASGLDLRHMLIWAKNNHVLGRADYNYKHEPIIYGWKGGAGHEFYGSPSETSLWEINKPHKSDLHPTMKPVELVERALNNSSKVGDSILDPFGGSGTTLIACERLSRVCRMMEIDPRYCDVIVRRWQEFTGKQAHLEGQPEALFDARQEAVQE